MQEEQQPAPETPHKKSHHKDTPEVYILRDWKEYLGESFLIIFSVLLALILTEYFSSLHEKKETKELLDNIRTELIHNKQKEQEQYTYQKNVLKAIDSALKSAALQQKILSNGVLHLEYIAPDGVVNADLTTVAWEIAKTHNITTKVSFKLVAKLTDIYANQARIDKVEEKVASVLLSWESRKPENIRTTLLLLRDNYKGWAFDRAPSLIAKYDDAIKMIDEEK
ncbi:hypothetical protein [Mucilaginibacter sp. BT774]|uniref:hypothetical protein n=1 Tax=Mucilaginibacter sp. BT774 TaxID=3062276 RepID=UPI0026761BCE|nr:hypothetical protein [Mucilaginibacter sp. BT774]MDO3625029.1 hypothetical protein [Mucilaginibacter sp. BT774]